MMNTATITAGQAARAMGLDEKGMMALLSESGVQTEGGLLTGADTEALLSFLEGRQEDSRRKAQENLERLAARYTFLIDTCSLLNEQFPTLMEHLTPLLRVNGKRLFVPSSVLAEGAAARRGGKLRGLPHGARPRHGASARAVHAACAGGALPQLEEG